MKFKKSLFTIVTIAPVLSPVLLVTGCNKNNDPTVKDIFDIQNDILIGLKQGVTQDDIISNIKDNTLVLPTVKEIKENAFINGTLLNSLPNNTKVVVNALRIGDYAFYGASNTSIEIELQYTIWIGKSAFAQMLGLKKIVLDDTLESIGANAFLGDTALEEIDATAFKTEETVSEVSIANISAFASVKKGGKIKADTALIGARLWSLFQQNGLPLDWDQVDKDGNPFPGGPLKPTPSYVFKYEINEDDEAVITGINEDWEYTFENFTVIQIPDTYQGKNITSIADNAFVYGSGTAGAKNLFPNTTTIRLGANLKKIGAYNFAYLTKLTTITYEALNLTTIGANAFMMCPKLKSFPHFLHEDNHIAEIKDNAFSGCTSMNISVILGLELTTLETTALANSGIKSITIKSKKISEICEDTFLLCKNLKTVDLSETKIQKVCKGAFSYCPELTEVKFSNQIQFIQEYAFYNADKLQYVTSLNNEAFFTSDLEDKFRWTEPIKIASILKEGGYIYKRLAYFEHHDLIFDTHYANKIKLKLAIDESKTSIVWERSKFIAGQVDFDESTYEITSVANITTLEPLPLKMTVTYPDPFDETETYELEDTLNITCLDDQVQTQQTDSICQYNPIRTGECNVACIKRDCEGIESKNWTYQIPDVYNSAYVVSIQDNGFGNPSDPTKASKFTHFSLPSVLQKINQSPFDHCGDNVPELEQRIGDTPRITFRGNNYTGMSFSANTFRNMIMGPKFILPEGIEALYMASFANLTKLKEFTVSSTVTMIQSNFIVNCPDVTGVVLPTGSRWMTDDKKYTFDASTPEENWIKLREHGDVQWKRIL